ncbi:MAG: hypothetical protein ACRD2W_02520 [Acidimicrobiales bacterium]
MVGKKDIIQTILVASSALSGLALVCLGLLMNSLRSYSAGRARGYRIVPNLVGAAFFCGITAIALCVSWLVLHQDSTARELAIVAFVGLLVLLCASALSALALFARKAD